MVSLVILGLGLSAFVSGCRIDAAAPAPAVEVWAVSDMFALAEDSPRPQADPAFDPASESVVLSAAGGETVSFQLVVEGDDDGLQGVSLAAGDLAGPGGAVIPAERIDIFRMQAVELSEFPAWYLRMRTVRPRRVPLYDAMIPIDAPRGGLPADVAPAQRLAFWFDLSVAPGTPAGDYTGRVQITAAGRRTELPLRVRVYGFALSPERAMLAVGGFDHDRLFAAFLQRDGKPFTPVWMDRQDPLVVQGLKIMRQLIRLGRAHRLDLFDRTLRPVVKRDLAGRVSINWADYEAVVGPYLDGSAFDERVGTAVWPVPVDETWPDPSPHGGANSPEYAEMIHQILRDTDKHFQALGLSRGFFFWPVRGRISDSAYRTQLLLSEIARSAAPDMPILSELPPELPTNRMLGVPEGFAGSFDMLAPPPRLLDAIGGRSLARGRGPLAGAYLVPGQTPFAPSVGLAASPADIRALGYLAGRYDLSGVFLPDVLNWPAPVGDQASLFYPGTIAGLDEVLPSVRLKRLRRGLQDQSYLLLMRRAGLEEVADGIVSTLAQYAGRQAAGDNYLDGRLDGWCDDPAAYGLALRAMAEAIGSAASADPEARRRYLAAMDNWDGYVRRSRGVQIEQATGRVFPADEGGKLRVEIDVELYNRRLDAVEVSVSLGALPAGVTLESADAPSMTLEPQSRATARIGALAEAFGSNSAAHVPLTVRVESGGAAVAETMVPVPVLVVQPAARPVKIDGDLSDWPASSGNAAGAFGLLGRRGRQGSGQASVQSNAFVMRDRENLYMAFRCDLADGQAPIARADNLVQYDQLLAGGEDLLEVLLDPGQAATGPEGLYHLVVKPNGVLVSERGVGCDPPLGESRPWASGARVAVRVSDEAWFVELAIPFSSLPAGAGEYWGVNFMRYCLAVRESSAWAPAVRYYYAPRYLGTMYVPPAAEHADLLGPG